MHTIILPISARTELVLESLSATIKAPEGQVNVN
jgi:hypothetical protein